MKTKSALLQLSTAVALGASLGISAGAFSFAAHASENAAAHGKTIATDKSLEHKTWRDLPTGFTNGSEIAYDMRDWGLILKETVYYTGRSARNIATKPRRQESLQGNLISQSTAVTRLEANRLGIHLYNAKHKEFVAETVERLAKVPTHVPLTDMSRSNQLAYWLNLRNAAMLNEIVKLYPITMVDGALTGENNILNKPVATVLGIPLSIAAMEDYIIETFNDPLVFYGFAYGVVGSPNFRTNAYRGDTVWQSLRSNAAEFVNSLRGVREAEQGTARISEFYNMHANLFDLDSEEFIMHLRSLAEDNLAADLEGVSAVNASFSDWHIADLINGRFRPDFTVRGFRGGPAALITKRTPQHGYELLRDIDFKNWRMSRKKRATVEVEDYTGATTQ